MIFLLKFILLTLTANALVLSSVAFSTYLDVSPDTLEASTEQARSHDVDVAKTTVEIRDDLFFIDGKQTRLLSGSIHYFRIVPELWEDRLQRLKAMGLNAITVYVAWNRHETKRGEFDFESPENDLEHFLQLAQNLNLYVIFRPGPYICAEWDFGGFPAWMLENGTISLRTYAQPYLSFVDAFYDKLLPRIRPFLHIESGGPILMVQVENEYGHFGDASTNPDDAKYLRHLVELTRKHLGDQVILFTTDPSDKIQKGSLPGDIIYTLVDGCHHPPGDYHKQQTMNPPGSSPFFCTETYTGWLSHWSEPKMQTRTTQKVTQDVKKVLDQVGGNASVSLYMGYGGTNFGFWSGSNWGDGKLQPHVTSYDYNAPIAEGGENGVDKNGVDKFEGFRDLFKSKSPELEFTSPPPLPPRVSSSMKLPFTHSIPLLAPEHLDAVTSLLKSGLQEPRAAETFGCYYGFVLYSGHLNHATKSGMLQLPKFQDRAHVFVDGERLGISYRNDANHSVALPSLEPGVEIAILVEHMGRINFDPNGMKDTRFGLFGSPLLEGTPLPLSWTARCLDFSSPTLLDNLQWTPQTRIKRGQQHESPRLPAFFMTELTSKANLVAGKDLFLRPEHDSKEAMSGKGVIWYNGFNAGRYWTQEGPQRSLYVPGPRTESKSPSGEDRIVVLELEQAAEHIWLEGEPKNIL